MGQIELESSKYMQKVMEEEQVRWRRTRDTKALQDIATFCFGVTAFVLAVWAFQEKETWLPIMQSFLQKI
jgi:hypothetical protein